MQCCSAGTTWPSKAAPWCAPQRDKNTDWRTDKHMWALDGVGQLVKRCPVHQKAPSLITGQGTCSCHRFDPWSGCLQEAADWCSSHQSFSLPLSKINKNIKKTKNRLLVSNSRIFHSLGLGWGRRISSQPVPRWCWGWWSGNHQIS